MHDIDGLSWRRFTTLLRGLGPQSACATRAHIRRMEERSGKKVHVVDGGPEQTVAVFTSLFGPAPDPGHPAEG